MRNPAGKGLEYSQLPIECKVEVIIEYFEPVQVVFSSAWDAIRGEKECLQKF